MVQEVDPVEYYGKQIGLHLGFRTILVEGTSDVDVFHFAASLEKSKTGGDLLGGGLAIVAAGERDRGGTRGVVRELISLRGMSRAALLPNGRPRYRFVGLFDNDKAGRQAVKDARYMDSSILEYKDVFRLRPVMPMTGNLDPKALERSFDSENGRYKGLDWELEDLVPGSVMAAFLAERPDAVARTHTVSGMIHRELTADGKARLHRFFRAHALHQDVEGIVRVLKALRMYLGLV